MAIKVANGIRLRIHHEEKHILARRLGKRSQLPDLIANLDGWQNEASDQLPHAMTINERRKSKNRNATPKTTKHTSCKAHKSHCLQTFVTILGHHTRDRKDRSLWNVDHLA
jgi:hypothetical protein